MGMSESDSFKMDCRSPLAAKLQADISAKLVQFLGNYSDDVLAEYIVVLVCNGKHQNQAREELQEFLGDESGNFVSWLWNHLSEELNLSKTSIDSSHSKANLSTSHDNTAENVHRGLRPADSHTVSAPISDITLLQNRKCEPSNFSPTLSKTIKEPELQRWCPSSGVVSREVGSDKTPKKTFASQKISGVADYKENGVKGYPSSAVRCSPDSSPVGEHPLPRENQAHKIARSRSSGADCLPLTSEKAELAPRTLRSVIAENHQLKHISPVNAVRRNQPTTSMDVVPDQNTRPRRNVWDRLGKPCNENDGLMRQNQSMHNHDLIIKKEWDRNGEGLHKPRSVHAVPDAILDGEIAEYDSYGRVIQKNHSDDAIQDFKFPTSVTHDQADNSRKKRLFSELNSGGSSASSSGRKEIPMQIKQTLFKQQDSLPIGNNLSQNWQEFGSEAKKLTTHAPEPARNPFKFSNRQPGRETDRIPQPQLNKRALVNVPMQNLIQSHKTEPVMSEPHTDALNAKTKHKSMEEETMHLKSRMHQVQMDVQRLRYKQAEMHIEPKHTGSSVLQNNSEEDIESRTILVTNVHFAAPREALFQHFTNCGTILKVIPLTDTVTAQPKGAAYVVFASKDSMDSALAMSGSSFFSRKLTVIRKADMPSGFLVPTQLAGKIPQPCYPQHLKKGGIHRPYTSSHLQWRRDQAASGESSVSAPTNGPGSSTTGQ